MPEPPRDAALFRVPALDCPDELALIEKCLRPLAGVEGLAPDYLNRTLRIEFDPQRVSPVQIAAAIGESGLDAEALEATAAPSEVHIPLRLRPTTLLGGGLLVAATVAWALAAPPRLTATLATLSAIVSGLPVGRAAARALRLRVLDMNVLMAIAGIGAIAVGEFFEAAAAMFLFGVSLWLESFSMGRARRAVQSLAALAPGVAHRLGAAPEARGGERPIEEVDPATLLRGDLLLVRPGERIPVDGVVLVGNSAVNEAPITGESLPVEKMPGAEVFAGTLNGEGSLELRAARAADESTLAHIARLVGQASSARSPTERFIDRFARHYTPAVIGLALLVAIFPPLLARWGVGWAASADGWEWFHRGLVLLVIACPCALIISTPVTIVCGLYRGARRGLLIKGGEHLEQAGRIDSMALDKTGTLTTGRLRLSRLLPAAGVGEEELLRIAAALERHSEHPLARAIADAADERGLTLPPVTDFAALRGYGVRATLEGQPCLVGNLRLLRDEQIDVALLEDGEAEESDGTLVAVAAGGRLLGGLQLADTIRADAADALRELAALGIRPLTLLTGDRRRAAEGVAAELQLDEVYAELLPEDKLELVRKLSAERPQLAMVGDGVNDAPALAAAPLGIALGSSASATALETADVVVMAPHVGRLPELVRLGRRTRRLLTQNITFALAAKAAVLLLAALGWATMWMAVAADVGASLVVIFNGMRLLGEREVGGGGDEG